MEIQAERTQRKTEEKERMVLENSGKYRQKMEKERKTTISKARNTKGQKNRPT